MQQNREVSVNWLRINVPSVAAAISAAVVITLYVSTLSGKIETMSTTQNTRSLIVDKTLENMSKQLDPLRNVPYRVDRLEAGLLATNNRIDQTMQIVGGKVDSLGERLNDLTTKVEVLANKIDSLTPQNKAELQSFPRRPNL